MTSETVVSGAAGLGAWNVAVVLNRESVDTAQQTVRAISNAAAHSTAIDLLVNGNPALGQALANGLQDTELGASIVRLRVWSIAFGDKAHAWNAYAHNIWPGHGMAFFVDGYSTPHRTALRLLADALDENPQWLAATGVPTSGRTAARLRETMEREGGLHGNLFVLTESTLLRIRQVDFRLPLGLYRTDATLGAALAFGLDPHACAWDPLGRIGIVAAASWDTQPKRWWSISELQGQARRKLRQAQGELENRAVQDLFAHRRQAPGSLPNRVDQLIDQWAEKNPSKLRDLLLRKPLVTIALRRLRQPRDWNAAAVAPVLVGEFGG